MIDHKKSRSVSIQSWAFVLAALITTCGVVVAACIQTGWIEKPLWAAAAKSQPRSATAQAWFVGTIESFDGPPVSEAPETIATHQTDEPEAIMTAEANTPAFLK